jgi:hypothetical protein
MRPSTRRQPLVRRMPSKFWRRMRPVAVGPVCFAALFMQNSGVVCALQLPVLHALQPCSCKARRDGMASPTSAAEDVPPQLTLKVSADRETREGKKRRHSLT